MGSEISIGGQALIEGVMMRNKDRYSMAVRRLDKKISVKIVKLGREKSIFYNLPIIRGCIRFVETLEIGLKSLTYSASESSGEDEKLNPFELIITILISVGMTILLFFIAPLFVARLLTNNRGIFFNLIDGIIRVVIFLAYLLIISLMPDVRRMFQYHGAEHMSVHCYEHKEKLTVKNVRKYSTLHPRCGTNFIIIVFMTSIFFFTLLPAQDFFGRLILRLILLPVIAGVAYEILKIGGRYTGNFLVRIITFPGMVLQMITTRKPDDGMIEVAIKALKEVI